MGLDRGSSGICVNESHIRTVFRLPPPPAHLKGEDRQYCKASQILFFQTGIYLTAANLSAGCQKESISQLKLIHILLSHYFGFANLSMLSSLPRLRLRSLLNMGHPKDVANLCHDRYRIYLALWLAI